MIPSFDVNGCLPSGEHAMTWKEVQQAFGWNAVRQTLLQGLGDLCRTLSAAGCSTLWLDGSFVTNKDEPGDFDAVWDHKSVPDLSALGALFLQDGQRDARKVRWGGDIFPNVIEASSGLVFADFFQRDRDDNPKGIVRIDLGGVTW